MFPSFGPLRLLPLIIGFTKFAPLLASQGSPPAHESCRPAWSPRGDLIAFDSNRDGYFALFVMNSNGAGQRRVTRDTVWSGHAAWSPDGRRLAFARGPEGHRHLFVISPDGSGLRQVTRGDGNDHYPAWSGDGTRLTFNSDRDGDREIFVVDSAGSHLRQLTHNRAQDDLPKWGPGDSAIVFDSNRDSAWAIWLVRPTGSGERRLMAGAAPVFSLDGEAMAYQGYPAKGIVSIYTIPSGRPDSATRLTWTEGFDYVPTWSPDRSALAFCSNRDGRAEIYRVQADGSRPTRLTVTPP